MQQEWLIQALCDRWSPSSFSVTTTAEEGQRIFVLVDKTIETVSILRADILLSMLKECTLQKSLGASSLQQSRASGHLFYKTFNWWSLVALELKRLLSKF